MTTGQKNSFAGQPDAQDILLRDADATDVKAIVNMLWDDEQGRHRESTLAEDLGTYTAAFKQIECDPNSQLFVAMRDDKVVGCLQLTIIPGLSYRGIWRALVEDVRVARSCRGHGIGSLLLAHAEKIARSRGCGLIELFVHRDRAEAHAFYEKAGYIGAHRGFRKSLRAL